MKVTTMKVKRKVRMVVKIGCENEEVDGGVGVELEDDFEIVKGGVASPEWDGDVVGGEGDRQ